MASSEHSSLAVGSILGTAGTIYTSLFMLLRLVDGSYGAGGKYHEAIEKVARPLFVARADGWLARRPFPS